MLPKNIKAIIFDLDQTLYSPGISREPGGSGLEMDLIDNIYEYIALHDYIESAEKVLDKLEKACLKLDTLPAGGSIPKELHQLGITQFRQLNIKPYRIWYISIQILFMFF